LIRQVDTGKDVNPEGGSPQLMLGHGFGYEKLTHQIVSNARYVQVLHENERKVDATEDSMTHIDCETTTFW
jgi:hypothetical protein